MSRQQHPIPNALVPVQADTQSTNVLWDISQWTVVVPGLQPVSPESPIGHQLHDPVSGSPE